jgi:DNA-directed RNA polymerase subunit K/omega
MVARPVAVGRYEFVVVAALRAHQLMQGCTPRLGGEHKATEMAQMEVAAGSVARLGAPDVNAAPTATVASQV